MEICQEMLHELEAEKVPRGLCDVLEQSCLIPFLEDYLENDSVRTTTKHVHTCISMSVLGVCCSALMFCCPVLPERPGRSFL